MGVVSTRRSKNTKKVEEPKLVPKFRLRVLANKTFDYIIERRLGVTEYTNSWSYIHEEPTGNCQLCCAADFVAVLKHVATQNDFDCLMGEIYVSTGKPLMLVDLRQYVEGVPACTCDDEECTCDNDPITEPCEEYEKFVKYAGDAVVLQKDYISSNDSDMTLFIINISRFRPKSLID